MQENGEFKSSRSYRSAPQDFVVLEEVILEIEAQYQRFVELTGEQLHYFEGHAVASNNFYRELQIVAKRHGLPYLGFSLEEPVRFRNTALYISMESIKSGYEPFLSLKKAAQKDYGPSGCAMFVCHPGYLDAYILKTSSLTIPRVLEVEMACSPETKKWLSEQGIQVITYDEL
uniref:ChbG/HpnK family deacetylase n=1 Tax=Enterocloster clostridioformis TaxID=1531 RepID=UPI0025A4D31A|nr:ChbG/HpnK family deacetylase [Enterocloster clostridioformis]